MAKKKKKKNLKGSPSQKTKPPSLGTLADQLQGLRAALADPAAAPPTPPAAAAAPTLSNPRLSQEAAPPPEAPLRDEDLFEQALAEMSESDIFAGKYHGDLPKSLPAPPPAPPPPTQTPEDAAAARRRIEQLRESMTFDQFVGKVEPMTRRGLYHEPKPRPAQELLKARGFAEEAPDSLIAPPLPKSGDGLHKIDQLHPAHKGILKRARLWGRQNEMPTLNVRGEGLEDALRQLELFMHQHWKEGAKYTRLIHGRGLQSEEGKPVLKPAVLGWLEGPGFRYVRGWAPELTREGDYGSLIVAMAPR